MRNYSIAVFLFLAFFAKVAVPFGAKVVASVDNEVITDYDVDSRILLMKKLGEIDQDLQVSEGLIFSARERLINDILLLKYGEAGGFFIPEAELDAAIKDFISSLGFNVSDVKNFLGHDAYKSAQLQLKSEIILSSLMHSHPGRNFTIGENEVKSLIAESSERRMTEAEARQLLTNIKLGEVRSNLMKSLTERAFIERR